MGFHLTESPLYRGFTVFWTVLKVKMQYWLAQIYQKYYCRAKCVRGHIPSRFGYFSRKSSRTVVCGRASEYTINFLHVDSCNSIIMSVQVESLVNEMTTCVRFCQTFPLFDSIFILFFGGVQTWRHTMIILKRTNTLRGLLYRYYVIINTTTIRKSIIRRAPHPSCDRELPE